jgi:hypothetical protein
VQGSPGSGLCAAMPTPEGNHGMICTAPSPRRRLFLPPNLGLGPGQVVLTLAGAETFLKPIRYAA